MDWTDLRFTTRGSQVEISGLRTYERKEQIRDTFRARWDKDRKVWATSMSMYDIGYILHPDHPVYDDNIMNQLKAELAKYPPAEGYLHSLCIICRPSRNAYGGQVYYSNGVLSMLCSDVPEVAAAVGTILDDHYQWYFMSNHD